MKKILLSTMAIIGLGTSLFAMAPDMMCQNQDGGKGSMQMDKQQMKQHNMQKHMGFGMQIIPNAPSLELSEEQSHKLMILSEEMKLEMMKSSYPTKQLAMESFINDKGVFDKAAYLNQATEKHQKMLNIKANYYEKALIVLTQTQIIELKDFESNNNKKNEFERKMYKQSQEKMMETYNKNSEKH